MKSKHCALTSLILGPILIFIGLLAEFIVFPSVLYEMVIKEMSLEPGTLAWDNFIEPPAPVYMKFIFFHVENPDEISHGGKPKVSERGPYVYREYRKKSNFVQVNGDSLQYEQTVKYVYDQRATDEANCLNGKNTTCSDEDELFLLNAALPGVVNFIVDSKNPILANLTGLILIGLNQLLQTDPFRDELFLDIKVKDLLFDGYTPGVLKAVFTVFDQLGISPEDIGLELPTIIADGSFGVFKGRNGTRETYLVGNGKFVNQDYTVIRSYDGSDKLPASWWPDVAPRPSSHAKGVKGICRDPLGTDGLQYHQFVSPRERLWLFNSDLCRSIWLDNIDEEIRKVRGINLLRFRPADDVFDMRNTNNYCYCPEFMECAKPSLIFEDTWDPADCFSKKCLDGVLKVFGCNQEAPVIFTAPHFYNCYRDLIYQVDGMQPDRDLHDTTVDIEPNTGVSMGVHKRIQANLILTPTSEISLLRHVREVIFPVFWLDEGADLDQENADKFSAMFVIPVTIAKGFIYGIGFVLGAILTIFSSGFLIVARGKSQGQKSKTYSSCG